jgi:hypothetical protein
LHDVERIEFEGDTMVLHIDGRLCRVPLLAASRRLAEAAEEQRRHYAVSPSGYGVHWPDLDEDLSIDGLLRVAERAAPVPTRS